VTLALAEMDLREGGRYTLGFDEAGKPRSVVKGVLKPSACLKNSSRQKSWNCTNLAGVAQSVIWKDFVKIDECLLQQTFARYPEKELSGFGKRIRNYVQKKFWRRGWIRRFQYLLFLWKIRFCAEIAKQKDSRITGRRGRAASIFSEGTCKKGVCRPPENNNAEQKPTERIYCGKPSIRDKAP